MRSWVWLVVAAAACGSNDERSAKAPDVVAPVPPPPASPVVVAPHSGGIQQIAVTDAGDVALTADDLDQLRLWPSLDGKREPVVVRAAAPKQLALGRDGDGLLAVVLDQARGLELIRLDRDGRVRGRVQLPPEPGFEEIVAISDGVLARRRDQRVVRYDSRGGLRGQLTPDPGERIVTLVVRRGGALAAIAQTAGPEASVLRRIDLGAELRWGDRVTLPEPLVPPIGLAPSGHRIVGVSAQTSALTIYELTPAPKVLERLVFDAGNEADRRAGFLDDDHAVSSDGIVLRWWSAKPRDPWTLYDSRLGTADAAPAIGDRIVVGSQDTSLVLSTGTALRYLGYRNLGSGTVNAVGAFAALAIGTDMVWLDRELRATRRYQGPVDTLQLVAVDDRHVVQSVRMHDGDPDAVVSSRKLRGSARSSKVTLVDTVTHEERTLGTWDEVFSVTYDEPTHVVALSVDRKVERFHFDLATNQVARLRALATDSNVTVMPTDPKTTAGVVAILHGALPLGANFEFFHDQPMDPQAMNPIASVRTPTEALPFGFDRKGRGYVTLGSELVAYPQVGAPEYIPLGEPARTGAVSADGERVVYLGATGIVAIDRKGVEQWRTPVWRANDVSFTSDQRTVLVTTQGGLIGLDAGTGKRTANGCAWGFGLETERASAVTFNTPNVCSEAR